MDNMNITEMASENNVTMETPVNEGEVVERKGSIIGAVVTTAGIILVYEGGKRLVKKTFSGIKNFFSKRKKGAEVEVVEEDAVEVECVEED